MTLSSHLSGLHERTLVWLVVAGILLALLGKLFYNVFFHPLRHVPGPKLCALTRLPYLRHHINGTTLHFLRELHEQYGEAVRYSPDEVSFISIESAFQDIYGFRTGEHKGHLNMSKDLRWFFEPVGGVKSILLADDKDHARIRRSLAHAFSDRALKSQEDVLQKYGNLLVDQMANAIEQSPGPQNLVRWYNWTTFDVIAALLFGESFGCLEETTTHKFVQLLLNSVPAGRMFYVIKNYPWLQYLGSRFKIRESKVRHDYFNYVKSQTIKRIQQKETDHPDFMTHLLEQGVIGKGLSEKEMYANATTLFTAGTETTATFLSAVSYMLCKSPAAYQKLKDEVRSLWNHSEDIDLRTATAEAPYLNAVVSEGLRLYAPVGAGFPRLVPAGGETISGYFIPEGTSVSVTHDSAYRSERNFTDADKFVPERWLELDDKYEGDKRRWVQPFNFGPRNCLGKNLAYAEARLFLAKMVWTFDFELDPISDNWPAKSLNMMLRIKPELMVHITKATQSA